MKKVVILFVAILLIPAFGNSQIIENLDYISPFNEGVSAIKKNNQWAFINNEGDIVINFRDDLVTTKSDDGNYPIFKEGRCLIVSIKEGISYFGYINISGETVIEPRFLNATNFNNNGAIALELTKEEIGKNTALGKSIVNYRYFEVIIDTDGKIKNYLNPKGVNVVLDKKFLREPPEFMSKQLSENLVAIKNENGKWTIRSIN